MDSYELLKKDILKAVEQFHKIPKDEVIRVISHLDADGISAASLIVKLLNTEDRKYSLSIVQQIKPDTLANLAKEPYDFFIFTDLGSGALSTIEKEFAGKKVIILDHHDPEKKGVESKDISFVNPHKFGIDGGKEVAGAGMAYLFASAADKRMEEFAHVAIIGAMGDMQEKGSFERINKEILEKAIEKKKIKVIRGLRMFGAQTRPLYKILEYTTDPYIPGVSGSESGSIQFLQQVGINPKNGTGWKKVKDLTKEEMQKLVTGVILTRFNEENPEDVLGNVYLLEEENEGSPTRDAKEFATLLNACGRMDKASLGIGACLGDIKLKKKAIATMGHYRKEIVSSLRWYEANADSELIIQGDSYMIINAQDSIRPTIIGTLASILSKSNNFTKQFIMSLAQLADGTTKVSLRMQGIHKDIDLKDLMMKMTTGIEDCEAGGHANAAGALMPTDVEQKFIENAKLVLAKASMEEIV
ncbi:DHH family phosphoesterase [Candidatus Woesearchaeota archaeon]|nr:DHH family phosphoesterase [Candidatus Woesearchaeota archaeon]